MTIDELAEVRRTEELKKTRPGPGSGWRGRSKSPPRWKHSPPRSLRRRISRSRSTDRNQAGGVVRRRRSSSRGRNMDPDVRKKSRSPDASRSQRKADEEKRISRDKEGKGEKRRKDSSSSPESKKHRRLVQISGSLKRKSTNPEKTGLEEKLKQMISQSAPKSRSREKLRDKKDKLEEGELSSGSSSSSDSSPERTSQTRRGKKKSSSMKKVLDSDSELDLEKEIEHLERRSKDSLRSEVGDLRKELNDLKDLVRNMSKDKEYGSKTINALDIIAREVRTKIMKNEETTTETILKLKVERKKKMIRAKLEKLKEDEGMRGKETKSGKKERREQNESMTEKNDQSRSEKRNKSRSEKKEKSRMESKDESRTPKKNDSRSEKRDESRTEKRDESRSEKRDESKSEKKDESKSEKRNESKSEKKDKNENPSDFKKQKRTKEYRKVEEESGSEDEVESKLLAAIKKR